MVGKTISHYQILEKLGEGGMGVVYKAEDTKLKREVALKFLPTNALQGQEEKARFTREAQAAAALNHPNIAHIYAIDEADGQMFLAMEFIEGQSLHEIVGANGRSPQRLEQAIDYATQIAAGLQAAHEKGVVHRDIKSANIMVTDKGVVKIMDFGLAKLANRSKMTQLGTTLGTAAYMSPEQARGEEADNRADIWSLGVVLYEMISGQLPFKGDYKQAVIYSIINEEPEPLTALRSGLPIALDGIIAKALAKDPETRYQHAEELPADLKGLTPCTIEASRVAYRQADRHARTGSPPRLLPWILFVAMAVVAGIAIWFGLGEEEPLVRRWNIRLPDSAPLTPVGSTPFSVGQPAFAISRDGRNLVFVAEIAGQTQLYLRPLDRFVATPIAGTEGAFFPFFSPDGNWIGFFADNQLKKVSISGGLPVSLCQTINPYGASWGADDIIMFTSNESRKLFTISASGGTPRLLAEKKSGYGWPEILPDREAVLSSGDLDSSGLLLWPSGKEITLTNGKNLRYVPTGHLVYTRGERLEAVAFEIDRLTVTGRPVPVLDDVRIDYRGAAQVAIFG